MGDRDRRRRLTARFLAASLSLAAAGPGAGWATPAHAAGDACPGGASHEGALLRPTLFSTIEVRAGEIPFAHAEADDDEVPAAWSARPAGAQSTGASGPAKVNVTYSGLPAEAEEAFESAVAAWEETVASDVPINVEARFEPLGADVLGGAAPAMFVRDPARSTPWYPVALADAIAGSDLLPRQPDIVARFNSDTSLWYFGTDGRPPADRFDFATVALHELSHGLGLIGGFSVDDGGTASWGSTSSDRHPTIFDTLVIDGDGRRLVDSRPNNSADLATALTGGALFFDGQAARRAGDGSPPRLHAPSAWETGTSVYHLDRAGLDPGSPDRLIGPALPPGLAIHRLGPVLRGMFVDLGWAAPSGAQPQPAPDDTTREVTAAAADQARPDQATAPTPLTAPAPDPVPTPRPAAPDPDATTSSNAPAPAAVPQPQAGGTVAASTDCPESRDRVTAATGMTLPAGTEEVASPPGADPRRTARIGVPSNALALTREASPFPWMVGGAAVLVVLGELTRRRATRARTP